MDEHTVVEAVCKKLTAEGYEVIQRLDTDQRGIDVIACKIGSDELLYVEAKGSTSSEIGTVRFGKPFSNSAVRKRVT